jgi:TatA/E family protein of Tat protein translocase
MATPASYLAIFDLGGTELLIIMVAVLIFFGGEKMPGFARGLGKAIREFKKATAGIEEEFKGAMEEPPPRPVVRPAAPKADAHQPAAAIPIEAKPPAEHPDFEHGEN